MDEWDWVAGMAETSDEDVIRSFADRMRWVIEQDYADEGTSARLPLSALADVLDAAAKRPIDLDDLDAKLKILDRYR